MITKRVRRFLAAWAVVTLLGIALLGNGKPDYDEGAVGLALALRKLPVTGSFLHTAAHPDDEDNALLILLSRGRGLRTGLLTLTRGDGGQNEIGPELFQALGIIRSGELLAMHEWSGAEQFFTRAFEFGYSFSVEETFEKWGREEILADTVRLIRRFRPDVIVSLNREGEGGGQHHQASARITAEAFRAAADPDRFPEQMAEGLRPWQALKLYERHRGRGRRGGNPTAAPDPGVVRMETGIFDPIFNRTYGELGAEARAMHKCQGMGQLPAPPGPRSSEWSLIDSVLPDAESHRDLMGGVEIGLEGILHHAGSEREKAPFLREGVRRLDRLITQIQSDFSMTEPSRIVLPLAQGLRTVREMRSQLRSSPLSEQAKYEVGFRLDEKADDFEKALRLARQFRLDVLVEDGAATPGQTFEVRVIASNGSGDLVPIPRMDIATPRDWSVVLPKDLPVHLEPYEVGNWTYQVTVGPNPRYSQPFWYRDDPSVDRFAIEEGADLNAPFSDPPVQVTATLEVDGLRVPVTRRAEYRYPGPWVGGEQRHALLVVPAVSVGVTPEISLLPLQQIGEGTEIRVTALFNQQEPAAARMSLQVPPGWRIEPAFHPLDFEREGQSITRRFQVFPGAGLSEGSYPVSANVELAGEKFQQGYQIIDYDHIERRHLYHPARSEIKAVNVAVADDLRVGYVIGVGDEVPPALRQLGLQVDFLSEDDLAFGDLSDYDTIITGVRAYLNREDLKANNDRLLDWVQGGGTLIVQYNKFEFNANGRENSPYAPFPVLVGRGRVTLEDAPVEVLLPGHPVFSNPNRIRAKDWEGWVQERGLYFLGDKAEAYRDLVSTADPFEYNEGEKRGALVEARYGEGRWIYVGLGLWRQLPAGVPGAYRLIANLVSLGGLQE